VGTWVSVRAAKRSIQYLAACIQGLSWDKSLALTSKNTWPVTPVTEELGRNHILAVANLVEKIASNYIWSYNPCEVRVG
jgi:hypothetical protein